MKTLAIETSCDDTSLAIIDNDNWIFNVEKIVMYSQIQQHIPYWWVLPEVASRLHSEKIVALVNEIWLNNIENVDFISVTTKPGLPGSLVVGRMAAYLLAEYYHKPLTEINHIHGHIFSILLERKIEDIECPLVILTASWGHNDLYVVTSEKLSWSDKNFPLFKEGGPFAVGDLKNPQSLCDSSFKKEQKMDSSAKASEWQLLDNTEQVWPFYVTKIWYTLDDAAWEAFDKVSKMLNGPYPWWPWISAQALKWKPNEKFQFKRIFLPLKDNQIFEFSFSWMKSQVLQLLSHMEKEWKSLTEQDVCDIAYEFQEATVETLWKRLIRAAKMYGAKTIAIAWWVSANKILAEYVQELVDEWNNSEYAEKKWLHVDFVHPVKNLYSTDNWAMIWVAGLLMNG